MIRFTEDRTPFITRAGQASAYTLNPTIQFLQCLFLSKAFFHKIINLRSPARSATVFKELRSIHMRFHYLRRITLTGIIPLYLHVRISSFIGIFIKVLYNRSPISRYSSSRSLLIDKPAVKTAIFGDLIQLLCIDITSSFFCCQHSLRPSDISTKSTRWEKYLTENLHTVHVSHIDHRS